MKFSKIALFTMAAGSAFVAEIVQAQGQMVKMCLFYNSPSGHARSDPIINQQCSSGHVHTFYGPLGFHPDTTYENLISTPPQLSTSPYVENQSLYWHPSIYEVTANGDGTETFTRVSELETSPYYRWDNSVEPKTEAFPPGFRMIAASDDFGANAGGENDLNMFTECCNYVNGQEDCQSWNKLHFPTRTCSFLGIAFAMPTCWDGIELGDKNNHKDHMRYTLNGQVAGECPPGFNRRVPQIQLFVRIPNYKGGKYQLSDGRSEFHVDFFNGWKEGKLQEIINGCPHNPDQEIGEYNPPCDCTPGEESNVSFLTENGNVPGAVCDNAVRRLIINEVTDVTTTLPMDACQGPPLIEKSWDQLSADLFTCEDIPPPNPTPRPVTPSPTPSPVTPSPIPGPVTPSPTPSPVTPNPTPSPVTPSPISGPLTPSPTPSPVTSNPTPSPVTPNPTPSPVTLSPTLAPSGDGDGDDDFGDEEYLTRWVVCGRGVGGGLKSCREGDMFEDYADSFHEVRCCKDGHGDGWLQKCRDSDAYADVFGMSKIDGDCHKMDFFGALDLCYEVGGRLCTKDEVLSSCTKGTGCGHDREVIWTCTEEENDCTQNSECCSGMCNEDGLCEPW